jgi:acylglycerol kinase
MMLAQTDGLVVAGGDGLVSEVVSGLIERTDGCLASGFSVGLLPSGTANAMANELDLFESES